MCWEPISEITSEIRGTKRVKVKTCHKEKAMVTAWFWASVLFPGSSPGQSIGNTVCFHHLLRSAQFCEGRGARETKAASDLYGCTSTVTGSGWMTGDSFFQRMIKDFFDTSKYPLEKTLFVLDLYASHPTEGVLSLFLDFDASLGQHATPTKRNHREYFRRGCNMLKTIFGAKVTRTSSSTLLILVRYLSSNYPFRRRNAGYLRGG